MILINQKDCLTSRKNLGLPDCIVEVGIPRGFIIVPKGWSLDLTSGVFDLAYANAQIQLGNFIPVLGAVEFTNNTPEPTTEEYQGGIMSVVRNGLPQFAFKFIKGGWKFASALYSYNSQQAFDILLVFGNGAIGGATNGTSITGFDLGMLNTGTYMFTDGNASGNVTVTMQLIDADQYNLNVAILTPDTLDFKANTDLLPITDIVVTILAAAASKITFRANFEMNESKGLGAIASTNVRITSNGVANAIVGALVYDTIAKTYEATVTTALVATELQVVQLYDVVVPTDVAKIGTKYYKGASKAFTAT